MRLNQSQNGCDPIACNTNCRSDQKSSLLSVRVPALSIFSFSYFFLNVGMGNSIVNALIYMHLESIVLRKCESIMNEKKIEVVIRIEN